LLDESDGHGHPFVFLLAEYKCCDTRLIAWKAEQYTNAATCWRIQSPPRQAEWGSSALGQGKYVSLRSMCSSGRESLAQKLGRHVPVLAVVGDNGDRLAIVPSDHSGRGWASIGFKCHAIADPELEHARVSAHLAQESQSFDDPIVEVDELGFGQSVDVKVHDCAFAKENSLSNAPVSEKWRGSMLLDR